MKNRAILLAFLLAAFTSLNVWAQDSCMNSLNLLVNCGFETGDFTGWNWNGNTGFTGTTNYPGYVHSGVWAAQMGPVGSDGYLWQNVGAANVQYYTVSLWLQNLGGPTNDFTVYWNGVDVGPDLFNSYQFPYTQLYGVLPGNSCDGCNSILFAFRQDPSYWTLDSTFVGAPEPGTMLMFGTGLLGALGVIRRKFNL